jgi:hypothetical protein
MDVLKILLMAAFLAFFTACEKETDFQNAGKDVELYIIKSYKVKIGTSEIVDSTVVLENQPLISYNQILSYTPKECKFELAKSAIDTINQEGGLKYHFKAFAVTVDKVIIYTGYFWPGYASTIKRWFTIDPILNLENTFKVQLAYPTDKFAGNYADMRNDSRIINVFKRDGKIRE